MDESPDRESGAQHSCQVDRLYERGRRLRDNAQEFGAAVREAYADIEQTVREQLGHHPYTTLGAAVGVGYVLGGGLPSRVTRWMIALGGRVAFARLVQEFTADTARGNGHGGEHAFGGSALS